MNQKLLPIEFIDKRRKYILFKNDCGVSDVSRWGGVYESYVFDFIKENINIEGANVVDVGANLGFHSIEFAEMVGNGGMVYSFEPQRLIFYQLCGNILLNGMDNVFCHNCCLGAQAGQIELENPDYYSEKTINIGDTHTDRFTAGRKEICKINTLDSFSLKNVRIIKIDVQGYESYVLDGAMETIKAFKPFLFLEIDPIHLSFYGIDKSEIFNKLEAMGYTIKKLHDADHIVDYVAIPK